MLPGAMRLGIECPFTDDPARALDIAQQFDGLTHEHRQNDWTPTATPSAARYLTNS